MSKPVLGKRESWAVKIRGFVAPCPSGTKCPYCSVPFVIKREKPLRLLVNAAYAHGYQTCVIRTKLIATEDQLILTPSLIILCTYTAPSHLQTLINTYKPSLKSCRK